MLSQTDPEAAGHVDQLMAGTGVGGHRRRFDRHAADGTGSGMVLADLRMHGAGPDDAFGRGRRGRRGRRAEIAVGIGDEFGPAARAAEVVRLAGVLGMVRGLGRVHAHAADRVLHLVGRRGAMRRGLGLVHPRVPFASSPCRV